MSCIQYKMGELGLSGLTYELTVKQFARWGLTCVDQPGNEMNKAIELERMNVKIRNYTKNKQH